MKNLLLSIYLSVLFCLPISIHAQQAHSLRCDLYFLKTSDQKAKPPAPSLAPRLKEYSLNLRVRTGLDDGPIPPLNELKNKLDLQVCEHLSWVIPSFSQKLFMSLSKENLVKPFTIVKETPSVFEELFQDYTGGEKPLVPAITVNRQLIGMMEVFAYKRKQIKFMLNIYDHPHRLQIQTECPLEQWVVIDTPTEVALLYISPL